MITQSAAITELVTALKNSAAFKTASVLVNDFEYPVKKSSADAPFAIFATGGFATDGCIITYNIPLTILNRYGVLPFKTALDGALTAQQAVIDALAGLGTVIRITGEEPVELVDDQLGHEFIIQQMMVTVGEGFE